MKRPREYLSTINTYHMNHLQTDFLLPRMSWITGAGSVINLAGTYYSYNLSDSEAEADGRAVLSDWSMVGEDLRNAFCKAGVPSGQ